MLRCRHPRFRTRLFCFEDRLTPAVTWDGGGMDDQWFTAANWSTNLVPGTSDDVELGGSSFGLIEYGGGTTTIKSLKLSDSLILTSGSLTVSGALTITSGRFLEANDADFDAAGVVNIDEGSLRSYVGGTITLPGLTAINSVAEAFIDARDGGSIDLPNLASIKSPNDYLRLFVYNGAEILMPSLTKLDGGFFDLYAVDPGSVIDAPALSTFTTSSSKQSLIQSTGAQIKVSASLTALDNVRMTVDDGGFPITQLVSFKNNDMLVYGGAHVFSNLTSIEGASIHAYDGATISLPGITAVPASTASDVYFTATGTGSMLTLPNAASVANQTIDRVRFVASFDGTVSIPAVTAFTDGQIELRGFEGGVINANSLSTFSAPSGRYSNLHATTDGVINVSTNLKSLDRVDVEIDGSGVFPTGQLTSYTRGSFYVYDGSPSLANVTNFAGASLYASGDATVNLSGVTSLPASDIGNTYFDADGTNTQLLLPNLTSVADQGFRIHFRAVNDGLVSIPALTSLAAGNAELRATFGGVIDAPLLTAISPPIGSYSFIIAVDGGKINMNSYPTSLERVQVEVSAAGFPLIQLTSFQHSYLYVYDGAYILTNLTSVFASSISTYYGASVTLPGITTIPASDTGDVYFEAAYGSSLLSFPNLVSVAGQNPFSIHFFAQSDGTISLPQLTSLAAGNSDLLANGKGKINAPLLASFSPPAGSSSFISVFDQGQITVSPSLASLDYTSLFIETASGFPTGQLTSFKHGAMYIYGGLPSFAALTELASSSVFVSGGATVSMPGVVSIPAIEAGSNDSYYQAEGMGSSLSFPNLTSLVGNHDNPTLLRAYDGGKLSMPGLATFDSGELYIYGQDESSLIDLSSLSSINIPTDDLGYVTAVGKATLKTAPSLTMNRVQFFFDDLAKFNFTSLLIGPESVATGFGQLTANVTNAGELRPGSSPGKLTVNGDYTQTSTGRLAIELGGYVVGTDFDQLAVTGKATLDGKLRADLVNVFEPQLADSFTVMTFANRVGTFAKYENLGAGNGVALSPVSGATDFKLTGVPAPDLVIDAFPGVPTVSNFGQTLNLSWTIRNDGAIATAGGWVDRVWLSTDIFVDAGDLLLGSKASPGTPLAIDGTYTSNLQVTLPLTPPRPDGIYFVLLQIDADDQLIEAGESNNVEVAFSNISNPPRVTEVIINDGKFQRSRIQSLTVVFNENVTFTPSADAAFSISRYGPGSPTGSVTLAPVSVDNSTSQTKVTLTFLNDAFYANGSLIDGNYTLTVLATAVSDGTLTLDGNGDGTTGDSHSFNFFRLFGDSTNDRYVGSDDFADFRRAFGAPPGFSPFDSNNDNNVTADDFAAFRRNFGINLAP